MANDMLRIGTSGILANQLLLNTAGNNIANVNTPGYSRQRVELTAEPLGGVGRTDVVRVMDQFALNQLRLDTSKLGLAESYLAQADRTDKLLGDADTGIGKGLETLFERMNTLNNEASSIPNRELFLAELENLVARYQRQSDQLASQQKEVNQQIGAYADEANSLISAIHSVNEQLASVNAGQSGGERAQLMDQRDEAIRRLSELVDIRVIPADNDAVNVMMANGQSLVLPGSKASFQAVPGDPEENRLELAVKLGPQAMTQQLSSVGGKLGGLGQFRSELLDPAQRQLGQLALAMADAFNRQHRLGLDLDGDIGGDIFKLPVAVAHDYSGNSSAGLTIEGRVVDGTALTAQDYRITFTSGTAYQIEALNEDGSPSGVITTGDTSTGPMVVDGVEYTFVSAGAFAAGDTFDMRPTRDAAAQLGLAIDRPQDLALASPVKAEQGSLNLGTAVVSSVVVSDTEPASSDFNTTPPPLLDATAPGKIVFLSATQYQLYEQDGVTPIGGPITATDLNDLLPAGSGFQVSLSGQPAAGDEFIISANVDSGTGVMTATSDNSNGLLLGQLQQKEVVRISDAGSAASGQSMNGAFAAMVSEVGGKTASMKVKAEAAKSLLAESQGRLESVAGVNLDEEAANLIQFQQAYAATARILSTSQTTFDSLLGALG
ncbi:flagellar hook-associated protein FlgK [Gallaecimonas sp. GXIMD4217]|uniref:flagellar hook-associated protein FlgK n=1 Tax=Gallaecimonas sp. GXIMD4217 TaxID=3131927 RepID=UPI00311AC243